MNLLSVINVKFWKINLKIFNINLINSLKKDNLNILFSNQMASYNKVDMGYESKNNSNTFINICNAQQMFKCKTYKFNYCNKNCHIDIFCFIKKSRESKPKYTPLYFYKKQC